MEVAGANAGRFGQYTLQHAPIYAESIWGGQHGGTVRVTEHPIIFFKLKTILNGETKCCHNRCDPSGVCGIVYCFGVFWGYCSAAVFLS